MNLRDRIGSRISDPADKRAYVRDLFGRIAGRYDLTNDVMSLGLHRRWKRQVVHLADLASGHRILDLAAGTGDLALTAAEVVDAGRGAGDAVAGAEPGTDRTDETLVVAADLTPAMMRVGRARRRADRVSWLTSDALALPVRDQTFDRVLIGYGLRNFPDLEHSLEEILRSLRPEGRLVALDFGKPRPKALRKAYLAYLDVSTRVVGWLLHQDPEAYAYIPESLRRYPGQREVTALMRDLGYVRTGFVELMGGMMAINFGNRPSGIAAPRPDAPATGRSPLSRS